MKSKIISLSRNEQRIIIIFKRDNQTIKNIEKTFQKLKSDFKLLSYKKKYGDKILENFWELNKKGEDFNFTIVAKKDFIKLKIKGSLDFMNKFLKILEEYAKFSELSPKVEAKFQRRGFKEEGF
jgi:acetolactate synthase small subunit